MKTITTSKLTLFETASAMFTFVASMAVIAFFRPLQASCAQNLVEVATGFTFGTFLTAIYEIGRQLGGAIAARKRLEPERRGTWIPPLGALSTFFLLAVAGFGWVVTRQGSIGAAFGVGALVGSVLVENGITRIAKRKCIVAPNPAVAEFAAIRVFMGDSQLELPHVIVEAEGEKAVFSIEEGGAVEGGIAPSKTRLTEAWLQIRRKELLEAWKQAKCGGKPFKIAGP